MTKVVAKCLIGMTDEYRTKLNFRIHYPTYGLVF